MRIFSVVSHSVRPSWITIQSSNKTVDKADEPIWNYTHHALNPSRSHCLEPFKVYATAIHSGIVNP